MYSKSKASASFFFSGESGRTDGSEKEKRSSLSSMDTINTTGSGETSAAASGAISATPFLLKTYEIVEGSGAPEVVSWNEEGTGFVVRSPDEFSQLILPRYFKHCNFSSFIRQLNTYGFKKCASDRWEFQHEKFRKCRRHLLTEITRRRCKPSAFPKFLRAREKYPEAPLHDLKEENKALQKKRAELLSQIAKYKTLEARLLKFLSLIN